MNGINNFSILQWYFCNYYVLVYLAPILKPLCVYCVYFGENLLWHNATFDLCIQQKLHALIIQSMQKMHVVLRWKIIFFSGHDFAYVRTAWLLWHVPISDLMASPESRLQLKSEDFNYEPQSTLYDGSQHCITWGQYWGLTILVDQDEMDSKQIISCPRQKLVG